MKHANKHRLPALLLYAAAALAPTHSAAEDIDIFTGAGGGAAIGPKILIVLDNTSNWARQNQQWPGGLQQGQSEARAINTVLSSIDSSINLGLMEFVTGGDANDDGGFVRYAIRPMDGTNKSALSKQLTTIYNDINGPEEKRNANTPYGNLMYDIWNYFNGANSYSPGGVIASKADSGGYTTTYSKFQSPLSDDNACGRNFVIFIGNPNASGPAADSAANGKTLTDLGGSVSPQLQVPEHTTKPTTTPKNLSYTTQCYASLAACSTTDNSFNSTACSSGDYTYCSCSTSNTTTSLDTCAPDTQRYSVLGNTVIGGTPVVVTENISDFGTSTGCYANAGAAATGIAAGDHGDLAVLSGSSSGGVTIAYSGISYTSAGTPVATTPACASTTSSTSTTNLLVYTGATATTACYKGNWAGDLVGTGLASSYPPVTSGNTTTTYTITSTNASDETGSGATTGCSGGAKHQIVTQSVAAVSVTTTTTTRSKYRVNRSYTKTTTTVPGATTTQTLLGNTAQCYANTGSIKEFEASCAGYNGGCSYSTPTGSAGVCTAGARYMVQGNKVETSVVPTGTFHLPATAANADEWARFMHKAKACNRAISSDCSDQIKQSITTYTIDVFNAQQNAEETELYMSMARAGGGKYFAAKSEAAIVDALRKILQEIQSVNSTFASASLPVNATNRTQNANQVFIGMFRPDPDANPRWYGNLKQYQIGKVGGDLDLVDVHGKPATNSLTGFVDDCAQSFWTTDSNNYWANIVVNPDAATNCSPTTIVAAPYNSSGVYSDVPDGPTVEKGAVAEVLRKGNNPGSTATWSANGRNMLTLNSGGTAVVAFNSTSSGLSPELTEFTRGVDIINPQPSPADPGNATGLYNASTNPSQTRPSIHGDVVHSRPLPVNYGAAGVTVYYGSNDGTLRAVDSSAGKERWALVLPRTLVPDNASKLQRLMDNNPGIDYGTFATLGNPRKDYFFDGSVGIYQAPTGGTNPPVWIYPTMRRGGRMVFGFDVSNPTVNPTLKWWHGCTSASGGCDADSAQMGQTWSTPNVAFISGYSTPTTKPVVVMGGGYDPCEDTNDIITTQCTSTKGNVVYFYDADDGHVITSFRTDRAVAADVNMIDLNNDGLVDYAYVADVGGNIYRIDFVASPYTPTALPCSPSCPANNTSSATSWFMRKVAKTNAAGQGRKFLFGPGLFPTGHWTYLAIVSGDREHPLVTDYPSSKLPYPNKAYVYKDDLALGIGTPAVDLDQDSNMLNVTDADSSTCTSTNLLTDASKKGWYMYLNQYGPGEQGVTAAVIVGGMVTFSTNRPLSKTLSCGTRLGEARGYFVNLFNGSGAIGTANNASCGGSRSSTFAGGGLPPSPVIGIVPIDGVPTAVLIGAVQRDGTSSSPIKPDKIVPPIKQNRERTYKYIKGDN